MRTVGFGVRTTPKFSDGHQPTTSLIALWSRLVKGSKKTEKRKQATRSKFTMLHITRRRDATYNTLQLRPGPHSYNNSKQQGKRYKANIIATAARPPSPPQAQTQALRHPKCHVKRRRRATHKGTSEGARTAVGCKADPKSTTSLPAPPRSPLVPCLVASGEPALRVTCRPLCCPAW